MSAIKIALGLASITMGAIKIHEAMGAKSPGLGLGRVPQHGRQGMPARGRPATFFARGPFDRRQGPVISGAPYSMQVHPVRSLEDRIRHIQGRIAKGMVDPQVYTFARRVVSRKCGDKWCIPEKDNLREMQAIFKAVRENVRYTSDILGVDTYQHPKHSLGLNSADCFPQGTLLLTDKHELVPVEELKIGQKIWGYDRWSEVENVWFKGVLPTTLIELNNGSQLRLTEDHKVYVETCPKHPASAKCRCRDGRVRQRIPVSELEEHHVLIAPEKIDFASPGANDFDAATHYVEGLYLADGWCDSSRFSISGLDGKPKEAQKREVEAFCQARNIPYRWHAKYIAVNFGDWTRERIGHMGAHAPDKRALSLHLAEDQARELLRGIMADSGKSANGGEHSRTFTSTSRMLAVQTRVLHRMFGRSGGSSYIVDHGGLGKHPIYRLSVRDAAGQRSEKTLRVKSITRGIVEEPVWDISTDDHYVYLPEHDVTVSNCDDFSSLLCSLLLSLGIPCRLKVIRTRDAKEWNHIYAEGGLPRAAPTRWYSLDASVPKPFGWEAPASMVAESRIFTVR
jgi:hypothetical protein